MLYLDFFLNFLELNLVGSKFIMALCSSSLVLNSYLGFICVILWFYLQILKLDLDWFSSNSCDYLN